MRASICDHDLDLLADKLCVACVAAAKKGRVRKNRALAQEKQPMEAVPVEVLFAGEAWPHQQAPTCLHLQPRAADVAGALGVLTELDLVAALIVALPTATAVAGVHRLHGLGRCHREVVSAFHEFRCVHPSARCRRCMAILGAAGCVLVAMAVHKCRRQQTALEKLLDPPAEAGPVPGKAVATGVAARVLPPPKRPAT
eukprot:CAMPEP_0115405312 /NCGR_PEP_ID=MMETSP0271-20121206/17865_1 /TAXON_ID=71861 /ORGANISM="Scrippsiella trochoidea, Strain CCMP3099" /LENGTH=197 /DNA_ID=CAMNT_0002829307 /DNA_START=391 /DNA_END=985 /DNA_ORIENTATION=-